MTARFLGRGLKQMAKTFHPLTDAMHEASAPSCLLQLLQQHYSTVVEPAVEVSPAEAASCAAGLGALTRAVEDRVTAALVAATSYLASQAPHSAGLHTRGPVCAADLSECGAGSCRLLCLQKYPACSQMCIWISCAS